MIDKIGRKRSLFPVTKLPLRDAKSLGKFSNKSRGKSNLRALTKDCHSLYQDLVSIQRFKPASVSNAKDSGACNNNFFHRSRLRFPLHSYHRVHRIKFQASHASTTIAYVERKSSVAREQRKRILVCPEETGREHAVISSCPSSIFSPFFPPFFLSRSGVQPRE